MKRVFLLIFVFIFAFLAVSYAQQFPQPPCRMFGYIFIDGKQVMFEDEIHPVLEIVDAQGFSFTPLAINDGVDRLNTYICDVPVKQDNGIIGAEEHDKLYFRAVYDGKEMTVTEPLEITMPARETWEACYERHDVYITEKTSKNVFLENAILNLQKTAGLR